MIVKSPRKRDLAVNIKIESEDGTSSLLERKDRVKYLGVLLASSIHGYNTRYASKQNLYKPKERTNSGKQTTAFSASFLWDNIPV